MNILIVAGEKSGDLQAAYLIEALSGILSDAEFWGIGGPSMRKAGVDTLIDISEIAVMGLLDVALSYRKINSAFDRIMREIKKRKPIGVILVDYPGFNLKLARKLKESGISVGYYISPQVWAWGVRRVKKMKRYVDRMVCILPFEKEFYAKFGMNVDYVGHPFFDHVKPEMSEKKFREITSINGKFIVMMPGSRVKEVKRHYTVMMEVLSILRLKYKDLCAVIPITETVKDYYKAKKIPDYIVLIEGMTYLAMSYAEAGLIASGSAVMEASMSLLPSVVIYRVDPLSWFFGSLLIKTPFFAISNLIAGKEILPEFIQKIDRFKIAGHMDKLLMHGDSYNETQRNLMKVKEQLGPSGAEIRAAKIFANLFTS